MRILLDGIAFQNSYQRGVQRYFRELLSRIARTETVDIFLGDPKSSELPADCGILYRREHFATSPYNPALRAWRKVQRRIAPTRFAGYSVFHSTFFTRSPEADLPEVVTVHDMIPERFEPQYNYWGEHHIALKLKTMNAARRLICISHATAADLSKIYPHLKDKVSVVHHGADHFTAPAAVRTASNDLPFLLFVGDRERYKNFDVVLAAMARPAWPKQLKLVATGPKPTDSERSAIARSNLESRVRFEGPVSDEKLRELYQNCAGFVFPALIEGFGFPLLEAQSLRVPVLCSDTPVFREIGGDAALFFDPGDPAALAAVAGQLLEQQHDAMIEAGVENVKRFSWDTCARLTVDVYRSAMI